MSNILRRPMFRGGRVESRGTGITSGLGYAKGGQVTPKRGLVDGPGGYAGISMSSIPSNIYNSIFGSGTANVGAGAVNTATTTGGQLLEAVNRPIQGPGLSPQMQAIENRLNQSARPVARSRIAQGALNLGGRLVGSFPTLSMAGATSAIFAPVAGLAAMNAPETVEELEVMKQYGPVDETWTEEMHTQYNEDRTLARKNGTPISMGDVTSSDQELQNILTNQIKKNKPAAVATEQKSPNLQQQVVSTEEPEMTVDDYIDLLGGKQARQRDMGDMLGRASAAFLKAPVRGEKRGVREALGDFMAAETAAGPGRREKIEQTAAMLDIKDKQATKRSKEQVNLFMEQEKFRDKLASDRSKGTINDQFLNARKSNQGVASSTAIAVKQSIPGYSSREFEVVEEPDVKKRNFTEKDVGKVIIQGNKSGTYTAVEVITKADGTVGFKTLYTSP